MNESAQRILANVLGRVERLFALAHQLEARLSAAQRDLAALAPSLLALAFREPASALLERIKTQHESQSRRDDRK